MKSPSADVNILRAESNISSKRLMRLVKNVGGEKKTHTHTCEYWKRFQKRHCAHFHLCDFNVTQG